MLPIFGLCLQMKGVYAFVIYYGLYALLKLLISDEVYKFNETLCAGGAAASILFRHFFNSFVSFLFLFFVPSYPHKFDLPNVQFSCSLSRIDLGLSLSPKPSFSILIS